MFPLEACRVRALSNDAKWSSRRRGHEKGLKKRASILFYCNGFPKFGSVECSVFRQVRERGVRYGPGVRSSASYQRSLHALKPESLRSKSRTRQRSKSALYVRYFCDLDHEPTRSPWPYAQTRQSYMAETRRLNGRSLNLQCPTAPNS